MAYYPIFLAIVLALVFRYVISRRISATAKKIVIGLTATTTLMLIVAPQFYLLIFITQTLIGVFVLLWRIVDDHNETDRQMSMRSPPTNVTPKPDGDGEAK